MTESIVVSFRLRVWFFMVSIWAVVVITVMAASYSHSGVDLK